MMSDAELVQQVVAGRGEAYEELAERWAGRVIALCHASVRRPEVAEELAQETLLRGFRDLATLLDRGRFGPWLCGIARHVCQDWLKSPQNAQVPFSVLGPDYEPDDDMTAHSPPLEPETDREDELRRLMAEVEALPDIYREVIMLYYYQDVTYRDLADMLDVTPAAINVRLTRARAMLRDRLLLRQQQQGTA